MFSRDGTWSEPPLKIIIFPGVVGSPLEIYFRDGSIATLCFMNIWCGELLNRLKKQGTSTNHFYSSVGPSPDLIIHHMRVVVTYMHAHSLL
jgi:hypothetical protein